MGFAPFISMIAALVMAGPSPAAPTPAPVVEAPPGSHPQLSFFQNSFGADHFLEIAAVDPNDGERVRLAGGEDVEDLGPLFETNVSWSADGSHFAVMAIRGIHYQAIHVIDADTGSERVVPHTYPNERIQGNAVLSPDGRTVAFLRVLPVRKDHPLGEAKAALYTIGVESGKVRRVTPWLQNSLIYPMAFSADGRTLAATRATTSESQAVEVKLGSGQVTVWARDAEEPALAPDGTMVAVRSYYPQEPDELVPFPPRRLIASDLLVLHAPGEETKVWHQPGGIASPSWDPSGARIAYTRLDGKVAVDRGTLHANSIEEINVDGTCRTALVTAGRDGVVSATSWRPGPTREAGSIRC